VRTSTEADADGPGIDCRSWVCTTACGCEVRADTRLTRQLISPPPDRRGKIATAKERADMVQDYKWLGLGGAFFGSSPKDRPFMLNVSKAGLLLDAHVDELPWRSSSGHQGLYLILQHDSSVAEPDIVDRQTDKDGIRTFVVTYNWLSDRFINQGAGAWNVLGVVSMVLATISQSAGIPLPRLSSRWYGDPDSVAY
jgi:hypothetical protein